MAVGEAFYFDWQVYWSSGPTALFASNRYRTPTSKHVKKIGPAQSGGELSAFWGRMVDGTYVHMHSIIREQPRLDCALNHVSRMWESEAHINWSMVMQRQHLLLELP